MSETAVVLLAMGGPDTLDAVEPFLRNLFLDPLIFPVPGQRFLGPWLAKRRAKKARGYYESMGGGSPLIAITERQARGVEAALGPGFRAFAAFRYWGPTAKDAVLAAQASGARRIVALPMYPQYCRATTLSSILDLRGAIEGTGLELVEIETYHADPAYVDALADAVAAALAGFPGGARPHVLLSAHGVPLRLARSGDPYVLEVEATARALAARLPEGVAWTLGWQSKVGPLRWTEPATDQVVRRLAREGVRDLCMVPLTFVADHVETLDEMDVRLRALAHESGIERFQRAAALNDSPAFVQALARLVRRHLGQLVEAAS